jgi:hypothetical protein
VGDDAGRDRAGCVRPCGCSDMGRHRNACPERGRLDYRQRDAAVHDRRRKERRSAGLCISCPAGDVRRADPGVMRCSRCRKRAAENQRGRIQEGWIVLDELTPLRALRELAGLSLAEAGQRAGLRGPTSVQGLERIEGSPEGGSTIHWDAEKACDGVGVRVAAPGATGEPHEAARVVPLSPRTRGQTCHGRLRAPGLWW